MADQNNNSPRLVVILYFWVLQFLIGYIAISLLLGTNPQSYYLASASSDTGNNNVEGDYNHLKNGDIAERCADCRITSESIGGLISQPRQMDAYGRVEDRIDLNKIKKAICKDIGCDKKRERCRNFYFSQKAVIEKWKHSQSQHRTSFFDFVCIKELKYCCPRNSFGSRCTKCSGCGPNEDCFGEGTRAGNGSCVCKEGHSGPKCTSCLPGYYIGSSTDSSSDNTSIARTQCRPCHRSCLYCRKDGPLGCEVCNSGFTWVPTYGCSDIDECIQSKNKVCGDNTFCVNTEGSYFCYGKYSI